MSSIVYTSEKEEFSWRYFNPLGILIHLLKYRELIWSLTIQSFRSLYQASYLGVAWQFIVPLIMLTFYYFVFGVVLGGKFSSSVVESHLEYALALFVGLSFFNVVASSIGSAPSLIVANQSYVKNHSFPLEVVPVTNVLNLVLTLCINLIITLIAFYISEHIIYPSAILIVFYLLCTLMISLGITWILSAIAVFLRDISALVSPITLILMFMCPIFYPASLVPSKLKWVININPVAVIIENARGCLLYGTWSSSITLIYVFALSLFLFITGYFVFMRTKCAFADVL